MIWFAILSGFPALPEDCTYLRQNLLIVDLGLMLRLRFSGLAEPMRGILSRLGPHPLPRGHYDELARMLAGDPSLVAWYAGQTVTIDTLELAEILSERIMRRGIF
jgi:hypothetical protein